MKEFEVLMGLVERPPYDIGKISAVLNNHTFSKEDLMRVAIKAAENYELCEILGEYGKKLEEDEDGDWYIRIYREYEPLYIEGVKNHPLIKVLELLLKHGLDSKYCVIEGSRNIMLALRFVDHPFLAAMCMRMLLEHGADPYVRDEDGDALFHDLDGDMAIDIDLLPDSIVQNWFQCWLVMIGYGARPRKVEPFHLQPGHTYDELKEFEYYEWKIRWEPEKKENIMHIFDIRTCEEIGWL